MLESEHTVEDEVIEPLDLSRRSQVEDEDAALYRLVQERYRARHPSGASSTLNTVLITRILYRKLYNTR